MPRPVNFTSTEPKCFGFGCWIGLVAIGFLGLGLEVIGFWFGVVPQAANGASATVVKDLRICVMFEDDGMGGLTGLRGTGSRSRPPAAYR